MSEQGNMGQPAKKQGKGKRKGARPWGQLSKTAAGTWRAAYIGPDGARHISPHGTYADEMAGEAWLIAERRLVDDPERWTPPAKRQADEKERRALTVEAYSKTWIAHADLRYRTRRDYEGSLRLRINPTLGDVPLVQLDRNAVLRWWRSLDKDEHPRACGKATEALSSLLTSAQHAGLIVDNPCVGAGIGSPSKRRSMPALTPAQVRNVADNMPEKWRLGVLLGAWCALRSGEVRDLRRNSIDLDRGVIRVTSGVIEISGKGPTSAAPKTPAAVREVPIPPAIVPDIQRHLALTPEAEEGAPLFQRHDKRQVDSHQWSEALISAFKNAGLSGYKFHDLRHTGLTRAVIAGATIPEVQRMAGHTTATAAMRYQEVATDHWSQVVQNFSANIEAGQGDEAGAK